MPVGTSLHREPAAQPARPAERRQKGRAVAALGELLLRARRRSRAPERRRIDVAALHVRGAIGEVREEELHGVGVPTLAGRCCATTTLCFACVPTQPLRGGGSPVLP